MVSRLTAPGSPRMLKLKGWPEMRVIFLLQHNRPGLSAGDAWHFRRHKRIASNWHEKYVKIFVREHYLFLEACARELRGTDNIMSKNKYPSIFSPQMEAIVFIILQIFFSTRAVLKIDHEILRHSPVCGHGAYLDQSHASKDTSWIIVKNMSGAPNDIDNYTNFAIEK